MLSFATVGAQRPGGSVSFAKARNTAPVPAVPEDGIAAGQRPVSPPERSRPQRIALTLILVGVFPMTHHVECVALLTQTGSHLR